jgi:hypothetical protein
VLGPVLGRTISAPSAAGLRLDEVLPDRRVDFLADLYLACAPHAESGDPFVDDAKVAALADACASVAEDWPMVVAAEIDNAMRARRFLVTIDTQLQGAR